MKRKKDSRWIFLSLFYPEYAWPSFLQKAVIPFLKQHAHHFNNYILHFGRTSGDYIGLSFEVYPDKYKQFVELAALYFKEFMEQFPARHTREEQATHMETKFMDFPTNHVCHSLHHFLPSLQGDNARYTKLWRESSDCLLKIYGVGSFDKEDFFTAALYLHLMLLLSCGKSSSHYLENLSAQLASAPVDEEYMEQFCEHETLLLEIKQDCLNIVHAIIDEELEPVAAWFKVLNEFLQTFKESDELQSLLLKEIIKWIRAQLNIVSDGRSFIDFCIDKLLNSDLRPGSLGTVINEKATTVSTL